MFESLRKNNLKYSVEENDKKLFEIRRDQQINNLKRLTKN
jgi:hypothetical protein